MQKKQSLLTGNLELLLSSQTSVKVRRRPTAELGQGWLCMCLCPGGLKNKVEAGRVSRPWEQREAAAVKMSQALSISLGTREESWVGSDGFTSLLFVQMLPCCYVHVGLQQPPLRKEQTPKLPREIQAVLCHNSCQRFVFHLFGMQQQD